MKYAHSLICLFLITGLVSFSPPKTDSLVDDVLKYTNQFRKSKGLPVLVIREDMSAIAQQHSDNMAKGKTRFGHSGFQKRESQIRSNIAEATRFAENVAYGSTSGKDVVDGWKNSPGHRQNMLGPYKYIGIGVASDKRGVLYYTQVFVD